MAAHNLHFADPEMQEVWDLIFADSDSEDEFEGFEVEEVNFRDVQRDETEWEIVNAADDDFEFAADRNLGWTPAVEDILVAPFTGTPGLNVDLPENASPLDFVKLFLQDEDIINLVEQTNVYAAQYLALNRENLGPNSRLRKWIDVNKHEMEMFIAMTIAMSLLHKNDLDDYWSINPVLTTPFFRSMMPRERFELILKFLHVNDNTGFVRRGQPGYDPLYKIRPLYDNVTRRLSEVYTCDKSISLDEGMVPWRGNLHFRQYLPNKPDRFGLKAYQVNEASTGYTSVFDVYTGKNYNPNTGADADEVDEGHTFNVVMGLLRKGNFLNQGYRLYIDNYYTSPKLVDHLRAEDTIVTGTVRNNRKEMPQALKLPLRADEVIFRQRNGVVAMKWKDKREVSMLSSLHMPVWKLVGLSRVTGEPVVKPKCIVDYNTNMGGTDLADQMIRSYNMHRRRSKWYIKLLFHLIALAVTNAYILHRKFSTVRLKHSKFRLEVIQTMVSQATTAPIPAPKGRRSIGQPLRRLDERHFPSPIPASPGSRKQNPTRQCVVHREFYKKHQDGKRPPESRIWCRKCEVALCTYPCFEIYHTRRHFDAVDPAMFNFEA